jgi:hypothetical protein
LAVATVFAGAIDELASTDLPRDVWHGVPPETLPETTDRH